MVFSVVHPDPGSDEYVGHLWRVPADGSSPARPFTRGHRDTAPVWSPDGRWVAFLRAEPKGKPQLCVVEGDGGEPVRLTEAPLGVSEAAWSPDSRRLVYVARVPDEGRYVADGDPSAEAPRLITHYQYRHDGIGFSVTAARTCSSSTSRPSRQRRDRGVRAGAASTHHGGPRRRRPALAAGRTARRGRRVGAPRARRRPAGRRGCRRRRRRRARRAASAHRRGGGLDLSVATVQPAADGAAVWVLAQDRGERDATSSPRRPRCTGSTSGRARRPGGRRAPTHRP